MLEDELALANELADSADEIALRWFRRASLEVRTKADTTPVTQADLEIESMVRDALRERHPDDAILGEEQGETGESARLWVLDPIDGTKNFADGVQVWATLIALMVEGRVQLGVASAPALGERYEAARGSGARLNGEPIRVSGTSALSEAFFCFAELEAWVGGPHWDAVVDLMRSTRRTRGFGDYWGHLLVARGSADLAVEPELSTWDWAALQVIVEEAGGRMTTLDGGQPVHRGSIVTTNSVLHDLVLARLRV
jgi:histidinol-phosphatase